MGKVRKTFLIQPNLVKKIETYQAENFISTLTGAVIRLITLGLESEKNHSHE